MNDERKIRSDAVLLNQPEEKQLELYRLMRGGMSYAEAKVWVENQQGLRVSDGALNAFWKYWSRKYNEERVLKAVTAANDIQQTAAENLPLVSAATLTALTQAAFEAALSNDAKSTKVFFDLVLKSQKQDIDAKRVELMERRMKQAEQAEQLVKEDITPEVREARLKEIFGLK